jgi:hypothetical protein
MKAKAIYLTARDGSLWAVPALVVAKCRAEHYADFYKDEGTLDKFFKETLELFEDENELKTWALDNMNWEDVRKFARKIAPAPQLTEDDMQRSWERGDWRIE